MIRLVEVPFCSKTHCFTSVTLVGCDCQWWDGKCPTSSQFLPKRPHWNICSDASVTVVFGSVTVVVVTATSDVTGIWRSQTMGDDHRKSVAANPVHLTNSLKSLTAEEFIGEGGCSPATWTVLLGVLAIFWFQIWLIHKARLNARLKWFYNTVET